MTTGRSATTPSSRSCSPGRPSPKTISALSAGGKPASSSVRSVVSTGKNTTGLSSKVPTTRYRSVPDGTVNATRSPTATCCSRAQVRLTSTVPSRRSPVPLATCSPSPATSRGSVAPMPSRSPPRCAIWNRSRITCSTPSTRRIRSATEGENGPPNTLLTT